MEYVRQIAKMFHDEHLATLAVLERFEALLHGRRADQPADAAADPDLARMMREIPVLIAGDLSAHFAFEEDILFPLLAAAGDATMGTLLTEEHESIRETAGQLTALCDTAAAGGMSEEVWQDLRRLGLEFVDQMKGHIQKEEMGLVVDLENTVGEDDDAELVMAYSAAR